MYTSTGDDLSSPAHVLARLDESEESIHQTANFSYQGLDASKDEIRLLRILPQNSTTKSPPEIRGEIFHVFLSEKPAYNALSYTWGDARDPQHEIILNGSRFWVRQNLFDALKEFSSWAWTSIPIWIDAICINQSSDEERSQQVGKMKRIYEQAAETIVWLGVHYEDSNAAFQCMKDIEMFSKFEHPVWAICVYLEDRGPPDNDTEVLSARGLLALSDLLTRPYWSRMWIVQELTVSKKIVFRMPGCAITAECMLKVQRLLQESQDGTGGFPEGKLAACIEDDPFPINALTRQGMVGMMAWKEAWESGNLTFHDCLMFHRLAEASNPRDKLYALAALETGRTKLPITVDYSASVAKVYTDFARAEMKMYRNLDILISVHIGPHPNPEGLPSWAPCWSSPNLKFHTPLGSVKDPMHSFSAAKDREAEFEFLNDGQVLRVKAILVSKIELLGDSTGMVDHEEHGKGTLAIYRWWNLHRNTCPSPEVGHLPCVERFMQALDCKTKTLESDALTKTKIQQRRFAALLTLYKKYVEFRTPGQMSSLDAETEELRHSIDGARVQEIVENGGTLSSLDEKGSQELRRKLYSHFIHIWDRRFCVMADGMMGLVPDMARVDDIICVLLGCPHPMVFRKKGEGWVVLGEAYVNGFMYGEAVDMMDRGELEALDFELL